jgi:hypothetical protein
MYINNANVITVAPIQIGLPVGMVGGTVAGAHRILLAKHSHLASAKRATDPAMRGRSCVLSEGIKPSDWTASEWMVSCPPMFQQSARTDCRMLRRDRMLERPAGEPTVTSWSELLN